MNENLPLPYYIYNYNEISYLNDCSNCLLILPVLYLIILFYILII